MRKKVKKVTRKKSTKRKTSKKKVTRKKSSKRKVKRKSSKRKVKKKTTKRKVKKKTTKRKSKKKTTKRKVKKKSTKRKVKRKSSKKKVKRKTTKKKVKKKSSKKKVKKKSSKKKSGFNMADLKSSIKSKLKKGTKVTSPKPKKSSGFSISDIKSQISSSMSRGFSKNNSHFKKSKKNKKDYIQTQVPGFDELFENGIPVGNAVIVAGGAGAGKTIFCLQTLYAHAMQGKKCLYMSFEESKENLIKHMKAFGWWNKKVQKNLLIQRFSPFEITRSVDALLMKAKGELLIDIKPVIFPKGYVPDLVVLDSLTAVASAFTEKEESYRIYIEQLFRFFEGVKTTTLLISETKQIPDVFSTTGVEEFLADGVIVFYVIKKGNSKENGIEVLKMRGEHHQKKIVAMEIGEDGITVYPDQEVFGALKDE
jgi:KaiC/GvpD/RAD55 family RecA-like ATPase